MKQQGDKAFADALNRLSVGALTEEDIRMFESRIFHEDQIPQDCLRLYYTNAKVNTYNERKINSINIEEYLSLAKDKAKTDVVGVGDKARILQAVSKLPITQTNCLPHSLRLKTTAKYMMTENINTDDGMTNGAGFVLKDVTATGTIPKVLWMQFFDPLIGQKLRSVQPHVNDASLTPVTRTKKTLQER